VCGLEARWKERPIASSEDWWVRCDRHRGEGSVRIAADDAFCVTWVEVRVAIATLGTDRGAATGHAVRVVTNVLEDAGAAVIGVKMPSKRASEPTSLGDAGRLQLAGPPEGKQHGNQPFWGDADAPRWHTGKRRGTG
jgi:hypothetical protein